MDSATPQSGKKSRKAKVYQLNILMLIVAVILAWLMGRDVGSADLNDGDPRLAVFAHYDYLLMFFRYAQYFRIDPQGRHLEPVDLSGKLGGTRDIVLITDKFMILREQVGNGQGERLYLFDAESRQCRQVLELPEEYNNTYLWDGKTGFYYNVLNHNSALLHFDWAAGKSEKIFDYIMEGETFGFHRGKQYFLLDRCFFITNRRGNWEEIKTSNTLVTYHLPDKRLTDLKIFDDSDQYNARQAPGSPAIAEGDRYMSYQLRDGVHLVDLEHGGQTLLPKPVLSYGWSLDGKMVLYTEPQSKSVFQSFSHFLESPETGPKNLYFYLPGEKWRYLACRMDRDAPWPLPYYSRLYAIPKEWKTAQFLFDRP